MRNSEQQFSVSGARVTNATKKSIEGIKDIESMGEIKDTKGIERLP